MFIERSNGGNIIMKSQSLPFHLMISLWLLWKHFWECVSLTIWVCVPQRVNVQSFIIQCIGSYTNSSRIKILVQTYYTSSTHKHMCHHLTT